MIKSFTDLHSWKKAHALVLEVYRVSKKLPSSEKYGLVSQVTRSATSIASNIAEGFGRETRADKLRFYVMARGSVYEIQSQLLVCRDLGYLSDEDYVAIDEGIEKTRMLLHGLIRSARSRT